MQTINARYQVKEIQTSVTQRGQVTIPAEIRKLLGIKPKEKVAFKIAGNQVQLSSTTFSLEKAFGSVIPKNRPENFEVISQTAKDEHAQKAILKMK